MNVLRSFLCLFPTAYQIPGRNEGVTALKDITLSEDSEFYPIRRGEFVILRGPSGGGNYLHFTFFHDFINFLLKTER